MAGLPYYPRVGELLLCNYPEKRLGAEMIKPRPCIVFAPRLKGRGTLCTIVPLSTTAPNPVEKWHCQLNISHPMPDSFPCQTPWAKCDMVDTVSLLRLEGLKIGRRKHLQMTISSQDLDRIKNCVKAALGF